ncbi:aminotransferase class V-fold PLP-dependent enzyme [Thermogymnomonas acidicola]|uniref:aminotransferase class V-fold PLP-dependent enzyme n=1 Tax=Thermogymnomonas acidicola TaxID=399579 RepID=UPI0013969A1A|nr:aminotransferase class V-fold PLP-dependent enzyme [Thermogymnomonas acidicola]
MMLIPGPVEVPASVQARATMVLNHRSGEFREIVRSIEERLNRFTGGAERSVVTTGSGTLAVESMVFSILRKGDRVVAAQNGEFSRRLVLSLRRRGGVDLKVVDSGEAGGAIGVESILAAAEEWGGATYVALVHNETGNGTAIRDINSVASHLSARGG